MSKYDASAIEVLTGLEPVQKRPGMYTDTSRPNHLAQEVIDNSVDEAVSGHASRIEVVLHKDGSMSVRDDGRGMPVDKHPEEGIPGVEVILTRLHAGGKFSDKNYQFSGGLHGVGVSVVNALSSRLEVEVRRDGDEYSMAFKKGAKTGKLKKIGTVGKRNTGTFIHFWPEKNISIRLIFPFHVSNMYCALKRYCVLDWKLLLPKKKPVTKKPGCMRAVCKIIWEKVCLKRKPCLRSRLRAI